MYSPKISDELIPVLYHTAKARGVRMTCLVDRLLYRALAVEPMPFEAYARFEPFRIAPLPGPGPFGTLEELTQIFHAGQALPFSNASEVDAWYASTVQGLCRALELGLDRTAEDVSRSAESVAFFRQLCALRTASQTFLRQPKEDLPACVGANGR